MSRFMRILLVGAIVLSFASIVEAKSVTIKAVTAWPKSVWEVGNFMKFMDIVKERVAKEYPGQLEIHKLADEFQHRTSGFESFRKRVRRLL